MELLDAPALIRSLEAEGARYVIIGGFAVWMHGGDRVTHDIDFAIGPTLENRQVVTRAMAPFRPRPQRSAPGSVWEWDVTCVRAPWSLWWTEAGRVDLILRFPGIEDGFEGLWARSVTMKFGGANGRIASVDDLIRMKEVAERPKDLHDLDRLRLIRNGEVPLPNPHPEGDHRS